MLGFDRSAVLRGAAAQAADHRFVEIANDQLGFPGHAINDSTLRFRRQPPQILEPVQHDVEPAGRRVLDRIGPSDPPTTLYLFTALTSASGRGRHLHWRRNDE